MLDQDHIKVHWKCGILDSQREWEPRVKIDIISVYIKWNELLNLNFPSTSTIPLFGIHNFSSNFQMNEWINVEWCHSSLFFCFCCYFNQFYFCLLFSSVEKEYSLSTSKDTEISITNAWWNGKIVITLIVVIGLDNESILEET